MGLLPLWTECENMLMGRSLSLIKPWISCLKKKKNSPTFKSAPSLPKPQWFFYLFVLSCGRMLWMISAHYLAPVNLLARHFCWSQPVWLLKQWSVPAPPLRWHQWKWDPSCSEGSAASLDNLPGGGGERRSRDVKNPSWCQVLAWVLFSICSKKYKCHHMSCLTEVFTRVLL